MIDFALTDEITNSPIIGNDLLLVIQQIDLLFNTDIYDVLGDTGYGSNYDKYLYTLGMSNDALESKIRHDISKLDLLGYSVNVDVTIVEGTERDIAMIDITISGNDITTNKIYLIK